MPKKARAGRARAFRVKARKVSRASQIHDAGEWNLQAAVDAVGLLYRQQVIVVDIEHGKMSVSIQAPQPSEQAPLADESVRENAAAHLASQLPTSFSKPDTQRAWREYSKELSDPTLTFLTLFAGALRKAGADTTRPRFIRLGRAWEKNPDGTRREVAPIELPLPKLLQWLAQEAYREVAEVAGKQSAFADGETEGVFVRDRSITEDMQIAARLAAAQMGQDAYNAEQMLRSGAPLSPQQREILNLKAQRLTNLEIANRLGVKPSTVRVQLHRARKSL